MKQQSDEINLTYLLREFEENRNLPRMWTVNHLTVLRRKQRWLLAFKKTNQNTQEVKTERFLIRTRQNNVQFLDKATNIY